MEGTDVDAHKMEEMSVEKSSMDFNEQALKII